MATSCDSLSHQSGPLKSDQRVYKCDAIDRRLKTGLHYNFFRTMSLMRVGLETATRLRWGGENWYHA